MTVYLVQTILFLRGGQVIVVPGGVFQDEAKANSARAGAQAIMAGLIDCSLVRVEGEQAEDSGATLRNVLSDMCGIERFSFRVEVHEVEDASRIVQASSVPTNGAGLIIS